MHLADLAIWIDEKRPEWAEEGAGVLERQGTTLWLPPHPFDNLFPTRRTVFIGPIEQTKAHRELEEQFVSIIVEPDMGLEHAQILIQAAVDQVVSR